jgi:hypothetical protein
MAGIHQRQETSFAGFSGSVLDFLPRVLAKPLIFKLVRAEGIEPSTLA